MEISKDNLDYKCFFDTNFQMLNRRQRKTTRPNARVVPDAWRPLTSARRHLSRRAVAVIVAGASASTTTIAAMVTRRKRFAIN